MAKSVRQIQKDYQQQKPPPLPNRFLGKVGNRDGDWNAGNGYIYVRDVVSGITVEAKNLIGSASLNYAVWVEKRGQDYYIVDVWNYLPQGENELPAQVPDHDHAWPDPNFTPIWPAAIMPFNVWPSSGFTVQIFGGVFMKSDGTFGKLANQTFDLSSYQPAAGALIVHFQYDDDGTVSVVTGTAIDDPRALSVADIPAATQHSMRVGVKLYESQSALRRDGLIDDFYDWRFGIPGLVDYALESLNTIAIDGVRVYSTIDPSASPPDDGMVLTYDAYSDAWVPAAAVGGGGDMLKSVYDTDDDGIVDQSEDTLAIDGVVVDNTSSPPTDGQVLAYDVHLDEYVPADAGAGDMLKSVYDTDDDGVVDNSENTQAIDGVPVDNYPPPSGEGPVDGQVLTYDEYYGAYVPATPAPSGSGSAEFQRVLTSDLVLADGESLVIIDYLDLNGYNLTFQGDAELLILGGVSSSGWDGDITAIDPNSSADIGEALADGDKLIVSNVSGANIVWATLTRLWTWIQSKLTTYKIDDLATGDDNTDLNASTSGHGLVVKATAPAATFVNVVGIGNGETVYSNKAIFDDSDYPTEVDAGTADKGNDVYAARRDHKHHSKLLSVMPFGFYLDAQPITTGPKYPYIAAIPWNITLGALYIGVKVSTTNNGSNYWTLTVKLSDGTTVASLDTSGISAGTWTTISTSPFTVDVTSILSTDIMMYLECTIGAGSPGALNLTPPVIDGGLT